MSVLVAILSLATHAAGQQEMVIHNFGFEADGNQVNAGVILDSKGNLYGTTTGGGLYNAGTVYELSPQPSGTWVETRLHDFALGKSDGSLPSAALTFDAAGNLYGTTTQGGDHDCGVVFELTPGVHANWAERILYSFTCSGASTTYSSLTVDQGGNLFGASYFGGKYGNGYVYELSPMRTGGWTASTIHSFKSGSGNGADGAFPFSNLVFDNAGNLYGTTWNGGPRRGGIAFRLSPTAGGQWTETILYGFEFNGSNGFFPSGNVAFDRNGNLYGTTNFGGAYAKGTVFELMPSATMWTETVLHSFDPDGTDGFSPYGGIRLDAAGNLYGTTAQGGSGWHGTVYRLSPTGDGNWSEDILYNFNSGLSGVYVGLAIDACRNLFGTTTDGGIYGWTGNSGTVYEVTP